jgi:hypothetical protein
LGLPLYLWGEAVLAATYLYNRTPHSSINFKTPYELKYNTKPDISNIRVWGSLTYYKNKGNNIKKLEPRANKGYLIGYGQNQYRIWDITLKRPIWSRDIKILENHFINSNTTNNNTTIENTSNELEVNLDSNSNTTTPTNNNNTIDSITTSNTIEDNNNLDQIDLINPDYYNNNTTTDISDTTSTIETLNNDIENSLDELVLVLLNNNNNEPKTYKQALESLNKDDWVY